MAKHSADRWARVSLALVDNLITALKENAILTEADVTTIRARALEGIQKAPFENEVNAEALFREMFLR